MSLSTFDCIPDFQGCRPLCALCCGRVGQTWHKQPKAGMLRLCKNGHSVKRTVFPVPHKGVRVGGQYGTRPSEKRRTRLLQNLNSQIFFKQKQRRTSSRLHGFVSPNLCVQAFVKQTVNAINPIVAYSLARVSGVHGPDSSDSWDSCRTFGTIWPN